MATIEKLARASGLVYKAKVRRQGHPTTTRTFKHRSDAEKWARKTEAELERDAAGLSNPAQKHTVASCITRFRAERLPELQPGTQVAYDIHLRYWTEHLGRLRLSDVTPSKLAEHRDALLATERKPASVNRMLAALAAVFTRCVKHWHLLEHNPVHRVAKLSENNARTRFLSQAELDRLLSACRDSDSPDLHLAVLLAVTTGCRKSELMMLRWSQVDLAAGVIRLEHTKNGDQRTLAIPRQIIPPLEQRNAAQQQGNVVELRADGLLFPSRASKNKPVDLRGAWLKAVERAGLGDFHWHDLRHSTASFLAAGGASLREIGEVLGHRSVEATRRYSHLTEQHSHALVRG
ncbi:MAG: site-specific integrase, partial [Thiohalocapsa sp.]